MKKLFVIISAVLLTCGIIAAPAFADETTPVFETKAEAQAALDKAKSDIPDGMEVVKEEVVKLDDKVVTDKEAYDEKVKHPEVTHEETVVDQEAYDEVIEHPAITHEETVIDQEAFNYVIEHPAITHEETVIDKEAWDEVIEHPAVTHEEIVVDKEAWDEQVCTPTTDPYAYKVEGDNRDGFTVEDGAFVLIKQASEYVIIWSEDAEFSDYPTAKEIATAAKDDSVKNQQVIKWKGLGEFYPGNLGQPWHHWYGFCKNSEGIYFWVDNISGISHADVYVPGKPGECIEVHHGRIVHYETVVDEEAWTETINHEAITHQETVVDKEAWTETVYQEAITHQEIIIDKPAWEEIVHHEAVTHKVIIIDKSAYEEIKHHEAVTHNEEQWTYVVEIEYINVPIYVQEVSVASAPASVLPKTGDTFGDFDSIIAIIAAICLAIILMSFFYKVEHKE